MATPSTQPKRYMTREDKLDYLATHSMYPESPDDADARVEDERRRIKTPWVYPVARPAKAVRRAALAYRWAYRNWRAMSRANPGHASLPRLAERVEATRRGLFESLAFVDRRQRQVFLYKCGL